MHDKLETQQISELIKDFYQPNVKNNKNLFNTIELFKKKSGS